jgi:Membrane transporters of cations and cationic drugs
MNKINWLFLIIAIVSESIATNSLKASNGFTNIVPSIIALAGYGSVLFFLSLAIRTIPVGIAYATWSGVGIIFIALVGCFWHKQRLDTAAIIGIGLIITGVVVMNVFSSTRTLLS